MSLVIDSQEASQHPSFEKFFSKMFKVEVKPLIAGDFFLFGLENNVVIERKSVLDFLESLKGRIWEQLAMMKAYEGNPTCRIILEGWTGKWRRRNWNESSIYSQLDAIVEKEKWNVPIIPTPDIRGTLSYIRWKAKSIGQPKEKKYYLPKIKMKPKTFEEQQLIVISAIGGLGVKHSMNLLQEFGCIRNIFNASEKELCSVPKIGKKTARQIVSIVSGEELK